MIKVFLYFNIFSVILFPCLVSSSYLINAAIRKEGALIPLKMIIIINITIIYYLLSFYRRGIFYCLSSSIYLAPSFAFGIHSYPQCRGGGLEFLLLLM